MVIKVTKILLALMIAWQPIAGYAQALPEGMVASEGVTLNTDDPNVLIVNAPDHATIDWDSFSIGADQSVRFILPNETSSILNRVVGGSATDIWGALYSNGNVFLVNTAGINFHANAVIDTASLIASTLDISKENFSAGSYVFEKSLSSQVGKILNEANFSAKNIVFIAEQIENRGVLEANLGRVILSSGAKQTLSFDGQGLINVVVNEGAANALIENSGTLRANGGKIMLTAKDLNNTLDTLINNTGVIEATRMEEVDGVIEFLSDDDGGIHSSGIIWGSELHESGYTFKSTGVLEVMQAYYDNIDGAIDLSGSISGTHTDTGNINFTGAITLTGDTTLTGDSDANEVGTIVMNGNSLTGGGFNLTMTTGEDVDLDGGITGVNLLTLNSSTVNDKTFTSTSADGTFSVTTLDTNYHSLFSRDEMDGSDRLIFSVSNALGGLQYIDTNGTTLGTDYKLANNIDASETSSWNAGAGFDPLGTCAGYCTVDGGAQYYTGTFDGDYKWVDGLFINRPTTYNVGLIGAMNGATVKNIGVTNADVTGDFFTGPLVGYSFNSSSIDNSYASGSSSGDDYTGGLVGINYVSSTIDNSYATTTVTGLAGSDYTGGLTGSNYGSSTIRDSYATGAVSGIGNVGGLVGFNWSNASISRSYATGAVSASSSRVGGLVGWNGSSSISHSFATGVASSSGSKGGLIGQYDTGTLTNNWWYNATNTVDIGDDGNVVDTQIAKATAASEFYNPAHDVYTGASTWDFGYDSPVWVTVVDNDAKTAGMPILSWQSDAVTVAGSGTAMSPYLITNVGQLQGIEHSLSASYQLANNINADVAGFNTNSGFDPLGDDATTGYSGTFDGANYTISNLYIDRGGVSYIGLFSYIEAAGNVQDLNLTNIYSDGGYRHGGLAGMSEGDISNVYVHGDMDILYSVGGLVGFMNGGTVTNSNTDVDMDNNGATGNSIGGLIGDMASGDVTTSYASVNITSSGKSTRVGGLIGWVQAGTVTKSYSVGEASIAGRHQVGGFVGRNTAGSITDSYSTVDIFTVPGTGYQEQDWGGFVGLNEGTIRRSYATGDAGASGGDGGAQEIGGFVGENQGTITDSFATGTVFGVANYQRGPFVGLDTGTLTNVHYAGTVNGGAGSNSTGTFEDDATDFYDSSHDVYTSGTAWTFGDGNGGWVEFSDQNPHLDFEWSTSITTLLQLQNMNLSLASNYTLANDIDASLTSTWNAGAGFNPVGNATTNFTGDFNGNNYTISNLFINRAATTYVGLFGYTVGSTIQNIGLTNVNITGNGRIGGLVGRLYTSSSIDNSYVTGSVTGSTHWVGGLVGSLGYSSVDNSYSTATVSSTAGGDVGGLVGYSYRGTIDNSYATGSVDGTWENGGLVGTAGGRTTVSGSYATGNVTSSNNTAGGLVGYLRYLSTIDNSYATGDVDSTNLKAGGLVGYSIMSSSIDNSYATGAVSGSGRVGGLVGQNDDSSISHSFATGVASSAGTKGGLVGEVDNATLTNNWWYNATNAVDVGDDGNVDDSQVAKANDESDFYSNLHSVYNGVSSWDFDTVWDPYADSNILPHLQWEDFGTPSFDVLPATESIILGFNPIEVSAEIQSILNSSYLENLLLGLSSENIMLDPFAVLFVGSLSANQIKKSGGNVELI